MTEYYIDTHCHLDLINNIQNRVAIEDGSPIKTITVTNAPSFFGPNVALFENSKNIRVALGLHPELGKQFQNQLNDFLNQLQNTRYVGEVGLDGSSRFKNSFALQKQIFEQILKGVSSFGNKILTIHSRNAARETVDLLKRINVSSNNKIILHWYTGDKSSLMQALKLGVYISVNHQMLQSVKGIEIMRNIPRHLLLTETDAPFTFDSVVKTRLASLELTCSILSKELKCEKKQVQNLIYQNFKNLLQ
jgi:TatD DNase family protein